MKPRSAEQRDHDARDDRGPKSLLRRHARGDAEPDRQRKRDHADGQSGGEIGEEILATIIPQRRNNRGSKHVQARRHGSAVLLFEKLPGGIQMRLAAEKEKFVTVAHFLIRARIDQIHPVALNAHDAGARQCPEPQFAD